MQIFPWQSWTWAIPAGKLCESASYSLDQSFCHFVFPSQEPSHQMSADNENGKGPEVLAGSQKLQYFNRYFEQFLL